MKRRYRPLGSGKTGRINKGARDRVDADGAVFRVCNRCDVERPLSDFPIDSSERLGHRVICGPCWRPKHAAYERARRATRKAREARRAAAMKAFQ